MKKLLIVCLGGLLSSGASAQYVTKVYSDYGGFWETTNGAMSPILPDSSHMLLGFVWGGNTFSTGVSDSTLYANSVSFSEARYRALDFASTITLGAVTHFHMGANCDGNPTGATGSIAITVDGVTSPLVFSSNVATQRAQARRLLEDGVRGLNMGTGLVNLPNQTLTLPLPANGVASGYNDGEPEFIVTQMAVPNTVDVDSICLVDASNNLLGVKVGLDFRSQLVNRVGRWNTDTRDKSSGAGITNEVDVNKSIQMIGLDFADFGLSAADVPLVAKVVFDFETLSDHAFLAYNERSFVDCATSGLTLTSISPRASTSPAAFDGEMVPSITGGTAPYSLRQVGTSTLIGNTDWDEFRAGVYMMEAVDDLNCVSTSAKRVMIPNVSCAP